jgi:hypothetical protein
MLLYYFTIVSDSRVIFACLLRVIRVSPFLLICSSVILYLQYRLYYVGLHVNNSPYLADITKNRIFAGFKPFGIVPS